MAISMVVDTVQFKDHSISHMLRVGVTSAGSSRSNISKQAKTMAKKKVVVKVSMNGRNQKFSLCPSFRRQDNRLKALQIATAVPGFQSLSLKGTDRDVIEVTGDEVDAAELTWKLRKRVGYANLETVTEVKEEKKQEEKKPKKEEPPKPAEPPVVWPHPSYVVTEPQPACCTIM